jgi:catechol 2,3-dioxygenase-like lactoylglutathione lyase family enzyme
VISGAKFVHTNLLARDWRELTCFYVEVFGCEPVAPSATNRGRGWIRPPVLGERTCGERTCGFPAWPGRTDA